MNQKQIIDPAVEQARILEARKRQWMRQREWSKNRISLFSVLLLGGVFLLITLFLLVFPRATVSEIEKRTLATFPKFSLSSYFSGEFTSGVTQYYDDTVPYRDALKNTGNQLKRLFGLRSDENTVTFINKSIVAEAESTPSASLIVPQGAESKLETDASQDDTTSDVPTETPPQKDFRAEEAEFSLSNGLLVVYQDEHWKCLSLFGGGSGDTYAEALNALRTKVGNTVKIYSMPAPLSSQFYVPSNAASYSSDQSACFEQIAEKLDSGIKAINICPELAKHTEEEIYCRTDHHWQALGAYYACAVFAKAAGVPFADLHQYTKETKEGYVGTMYAFSEDSRILNDPEVFTYYVPTCDYTAYYYDTAFSYQFEDDLFFDVSTASSYLTFMGSDDYTVKVKTKVNNGRRLLVIKDSYGNAEIPFLTSSFEEIYAVDMRYFEKNIPNFIETMGITDVLFSMCSYSVVGDNANNLMNLLTQDADSTIVDEQPDSKTPAEEEP